MKSRSPSRLYLTIVSGRSCPWMISGRTLFVGLSSAAGMSATCSRVIRLQPLQAPPTHRRQPVDDSIPYAITIDTTIQSTDTNYRHLARTGLRSAAAVVWRRVARHPCPHTPCSLRDNHPSRAESPRDGRDKRPGSWRGVETSTHTMKATPCTPQDAWGPGEHVPSLAAPCRIQRACAQSRHQGAPGGAGRGLHQ